MCTKFLCRMGVNLLLMVLKESQFRLKGMGRGARAPCPPPSNKDMIRLHTVLMILSVLLAYYAACVSVLLDF